MERTYYSVDDIAKASNRCREAIIQKCRNERTTEAEASEMVEIFISASRLLIEELEKEA